MIDWNRIKRIKKSEWPKGSSIDYLLSVIDELKTQNDQCAQLYYKTIAGWNCECKYENGIVVEPCKECTKENWL